MEKYGTVRQNIDDNIAQRMRFGYGIPKGYKHTPRICNSYCSNTAKMVARTRLNVTLHIRGTLSVSFSAACRTKY
jgi:hypothetical protein